MKSVNGHAVQEDYILREDNRFRYIGSGSLLGITLQDTTSIPVGSINLGSVYENVVAQELRAHGHRLYYYDNRKQGEVDYLVDNHTTMSAHPIEVKSGKDYTVHSALNNLLKVPEYNVLAATVISNERKVYQDGKVTYMPVYFVMFMEADTPQTDEKEYIF